MCKTVKLLYLLFLNGNSLAVLIHLLHGVALFCGNSGVGAGRGVIGYEIPLVVQMDGVQEEFGGDVLLPVLTLAEDNINADFVLS